MIVKLLVVLQVALLLYRYDEENVSFLSSSILIIIYWSLAEAQLHVDIKLISQ